MEEHQPLVQPLVSEAGHTPVTCFFKVTAEQLPMLAHCVFRYVSLQEFRVQWRAKQAN